MKRILIDTHVLLWWLSGDTALGEKSQAMIADEANEIYVSAASTWEMAIKRKKGLLEVPDDFEAIVEDSGFIELPMHHADPFDRMLIAQAQAEGLKLMTKDSAFPLYGVNLIDATQ